ncbi:MAG: mechanosensitive ion channel family protein [Endomicrobiales bacterium]|jgi:small-conductance mechanosensitive channel
MNLSHFQLWFLAIVIVAASYGVGIVLRTILFYFLRQWAKSNDDIIDDTILESSSSYILFLCVLVGVYISSYVLPLNTSIQLIVLKIVTGFAIGGVTLLIASLVHSIIETYMQKKALYHPQTSLTQNIIRAIIIIIGGLVILSHFGISITPLLTALGVGSLAVALALQDTLSNLFAGFHIIASKQIRTGDYVKMDSGQEGVIIDIGWRNTCIKQPINNIVIIPNTKITNSIITNYTLQDKESGFSIPLRVAYDSDLGKVEQTTIEVAQEVLASVAGGVKQFKPDIQFTAFGDSSINFNVNLRARELSDQGAITHEFIKKIIPRFKKESIDIPYPQKVVHFKELTQ